MVVSRANARSGHPIQVAARRSGLTQDVIRVWERRYGAVTPYRTPTNRRLYSDEDVDRLLLLGRATRAGRRIGDVANLSLDELRAMVQEDQEAAARVAVSGTRPSDATARRHFADGVVAIRELNAAGLRTVLQSAAGDLTHPVLFDQFLDPLMTEIGNLWHAGSLRIAHEHLATGVVRTFLGALLDGARAPDGAPELIVATPVGQLHELGALMAACAAAGDGWRVSYCGRELPADEIVAAAHARDARAVALSISFPGDDPRLPDELRRLGGRLGGDALLFVGGAAAPAYEGALREVAARIVDDIATFLSDLKALR